MLEDGRLFTGRSCGAPGTVTGEVCFNTSMTGYTEILTDPSYHGQILSLTTAEVGVCGARGTRAFIAECCSGSRFSAEAMESGMIEINISSGPDESRYAASSGRVTSAANLENTFLEAIAVKV